MLQQVIDEDLTNFYAKEAPILQKINVETCLLRSNMMNVVNGSATLELKGRLTQLKQTKMITTRQQRLHHTLHHTLQYSYSTKLILYIILYNEEILHFSVKKTPASRRQTVKKRSRKTKKVLGE